MDDKYCEKDFRLFVGVYLDSYNVNTRILFIMKENVLGEFIKRKFNRVYNLLKKRDEIFQKI